MKPRLVTVWIVLGCLLSATSAFAAVAVKAGDEWLGPPEELGPPTGQMKVGNRVLYRWPEIEIVVQNDRVASVKLIDVVAEQASAQRREAAAKKAEAERKEAAERAAAAEALAEVKRQEIAKAARDAQESEQARQLAEQAAALAAQAKSLEAKNAALLRERAARLVSLEKEFSVLRFAIKRAKENGDEEAVRRLLGVLRAKASEYDKLRDAGGS